MKSFGWLNYHLQGFLCNILTTTVDQIKPYVIQSVFCKSTLNADSVVFHWTLKISSTNLKAIVQSKLQFKHLIIATTFTL